jgi:hypothetical protein
MLQSFSEPVDALVIYRRGAPHPLLQAFRWKNRRYDVSSVHLVHQEKQGETTYLCYSVDCGGDTFFLRLNTQRGVWQIDGIETEA